MISTARHHDYFDTLKHSYTPITIVGAGAVGSKIFEALICLGLKDIIVYDFDKIEHQNIANQLFTVNDVDKYKVDALYDWATYKSGEKLPKDNFKHTKVEGNMKGAMKGIVFLLTDTMSSRKEIYENSLRFNSAVDLVIETRMSLTHGNIYLFNPKNTRQSREWLATLISDDAPTTDESLCGTALTIGTTASVIANTAVSHLVHYMRGDDPDQITDIFLEPCFTTTKRWDN